SSTAGTRGHIGAFGRHPTIYPNYIFMRLSELRPATGRAWRASELRPLMKFAREVWNPAEMCAMFSFYNPPKIPDPTWAAGERQLRPWIGWITYLPPDLATRAKYPADVEVEALTDGAALVTLCEEPFGKGDAEGLARLHALEAALRPIQS
ncbi:MAG: Imm52 family immunity protein, partial [Roseiarcus sp.]